MNHTMRIILSLGSMLALSACAVYRRAEQESEISDHG